MDEGLRRYEARRTTSYAIQHDIDQVSKYLIMTNDLNHFAQLYSKFLAERNLIGFWKEIANSSVDVPAMPGLSKLEWEVLASDILSPNALLFRMIEIAKLQEKQHVYARLLPLYRQTVA